MKKEKIILSSVITLFIILTAGLFIYVSQFKKVLEKPEFKGFIEASIYLAEFNEIVESSERLIELEIVRELSSNEINELKGESKYSIKNHTYFEAEILYDFYDPSKNGEIIFLVQDANYEWQIKGHPVYQISDRYVMFIAKNRPEDDCWGAYAGANSVFDVTESNGETYLYKRLGDIPIEGLPMSSAEVKVVTSIEENPALYSKKITLGSLLSVVEDYRKAIDDSSLEPDIHPQSNSDTIDEYETYETIETDDTTEKAITD